VVSTSFLHPPVAVQLPTIRMPVSVGVVVAVTVRRSIERIVSIAVVVVAVVIPLAFAPFVFPPFMALMFALAFSPFMVIATVAVADISVIVSVPRKSDRWYGKHCNPR
jgi:hypothetical protein